MEPSGLPKIAQHVPDPSGTLHNLPVLLNLPYMPETIPDTPGPFQTLLGSAGTSRNHSETIRDTLGTLLSYLHKFSDISELP